MSNFKGIIKSIHIDRFRRFNNIDINLFPNLTAIAGQNATLKSTLLGLISQPFSFKAMPLDNPEDSEEFNDPNESDFYHQKTIEGLSFQGKLSDKFKLGPKDIPGEHLWHIEFTDYNLFNRKSIELESIKRGAQGLRFWTTDGREKGQGYIRFPVIFLSLKRLSPIGEEKKININNEFLSKDEESIYIQEHNYILSLSDEINGIDYLSSSNKKTAGPRSDKVDSTAISAGQDNIGKILLSILSFNRLKSKYPEDYKGGLLLIDELDATLFPSAQVKLLERLRHWSTKLSLQVVFTTHSPTIIFELYKEDYRFSSGIVYLYKGDGTLKAYNNPSFEQINADLTLVPLAKPKVDKIRVYTEDREAIDFTKSLLDLNIRKHLDFINVSLGANEYIYLVQKRKVPEFVNSIIVLDGDKYPELSKKRISNIICLPGGPENMAPDELLYTFLYNLPESDTFWPASKSGSIGLYSKQICFSGLTNQKKERIFYKNWYISQRSYWGERTNKAFLRWLKEYPQSGLEFKEKFIKIFNSLAKKKGISPLGK